MDDPTTSTSELRAIQDERVRDEREREQDADTDALARAHARRADKAAYLRERLAEAERSEREG
jgi:hypothetical protein